MSFTSMQMLSVSLMSPLAKRARCWGEESLRQAWRHPGTGKEWRQSQSPHRPLDQAFHPKGRNKRTVWEIPLSKFPDAHFAVFPERLIEPCILAGSNSNGLILDPFLGSGTTALVARRLGRNYIGIDCNIKYCEMAKNRLAQQCLGLPF